MGGEGSISAMRTSLKNNNSLLKKKSRDYFQNKTYYKNKYKQKLKSQPNLSEKELFEFRKKLKLERRKNDIKRFVLLIILTVEMILLINYIFF